MSLPEDTEFADLDVSDSEMQALEDEMPALAAIRQFADRAARVNWFCRLGEDLTPDTRLLAQNYLDRLGLPDAGIAPLTDWQDAADAALSMDMNNAAWEIEEQFRAAATYEALAVISEEGLGVLLAHLASQVSETVKDCVDEALYYADEAPETFVNLAIGAAQQACHGAALAIAARAAEKIQAGESDLSALAQDPEMVNHPLMLRFQIFEQGRWPVSLIGLSLNLF